MAAKTQAAFLKWLAEWQTGLEALDLKHALRDPACAAVCIENPVNGFAFEGEFSSPRLGALVKPITMLVQRAHDLGVRNFVLLQDAHSERAEEFKQFPVHCLRGSREAQTVEPLRSLPFAGEFFVIKKNTVYPSFNTDFERWLDTHQDLDTFIIAGGCTDLGVYHTAINLKLYASARDLPRRVIVPATLVDTFDRPINGVTKGRVLPHDAGLMQHVFLYHLALCGVEVVQDIV